MNNILEVRRLRKSYPTFTLNDVSFDVPSGYIMGFIGTNGAGKTTTIKLRQNFCLLFHSPLSWRGISLYYRWET